MVIFYRVNPTDTAWTNESLYPYKQLAFFDDIVYTGGGGFVYFRANRGGQGLDR